MGRLALTDGTERFSVEFGTIIYNDAKTPHWGEVLLDCRWLPSAAFCF